MARTSRWRSVGLGVLLLTLVPGLAATHEVRPAYLEIIQTAPQQYVVTWKQPVMGDIAVRLQPHLSNGWLDLQPSATTATVSFLVKRWDITAPGEVSLEGERITIAGLEQTITDALVIVRLLDGQQVQTVVKPKQPSLILQFNQQPALAVPAYLGLGVEHILTGVDHLLFVLGLMLLVRGRWRLIQTITAFTLAHSLTLAATALRLVHVQPAIVEALVAMSIMFLAVELVEGSRGRAGVSVRYPWLIAFAFGLLHGFAFAGALAEIGLPREAMALSLFLFNGGVEIGQVMFVAVVLAAAALGGRLPWQRQLWTRWLPSYGIGTVASYWFIERLALVFAR